MARTSSRPRAVVIGSGAGGLTAAASLARAGVEVVTLERAKQLGGFLNPFKRGRYRFDPGVHYVGTAWRGGLLDLVLRRLELDAEALFCELDPDGFDMIRFPGFELRVPRGLDRLRQRMLEAFPGDARELNAFFRQLTRLHSLSHPPRLRLSRLRGLGIGARWYQQSFAQLLAASFRNPQVRAVLAAQCGDYGLPPSRAPALIGVLLLLHFVDGAYFPRGGSGTLRDALVQRGREAGASYRRRAEVTRIEVERGRVTGVTLASGERVPADVVVSAIDPALTYGQLIDPERLPARVVRKARALQPSVGSVCVFLGLERDLRAHGLGAYNVWDYPSWDIEESFGPACDGYLPRDHAFFLSPNSLKDDSGALAPAGCSTLEIVTLAAHRPFARWAHETPLKRGEEYKEFKREVADGLLAAVERRWPGLIGDVAVEEVSTPLTNTHFAGSVEGGIYGPMATASQWGHRAFRPVGPVRGLFNAGAAIIAPGVVTSLASGIAAGEAAAVFAKARGLASSLAPPRWLAAER